MNRITSLIAKVVIVATLLSCCGEAARNHSSEYIHLHSAGGWGFDSDIWLLPDDSYLVRTVDSGSGEIEEQTRGRSYGASQRLTRQATDEEAWELTSDDLESDLKAAEHGAIVGVTDASHDYLEFRAKEHTLIADFYAAEPLAKAYPNAKQLAAFDRLIQSLRKETSQKQSQPGR